MKTGLVLEGGGMRGIYTAGVLDVLLEQKIRFDGVIGVSAGAIHGCSFVSKQHGRSIRYYRKYCRDKRFMSLYSLLTTGNLVGEEFCYHEIPEKLDPFDEESFAHSPTRFYAACTDVETGRPVYVRIRRMKEGVRYMMASASMPLVSRIVEEGGRKLLDGGIADSIPLRAFERAGHEKNLVVLTRPEGYRKKESRNTLGRIVYRRYPAFVRAMALRPRRYNATLDYIAQAEAEGRAFVIRPSRDLKISRTERNPDRLLEQYQLGREDAEAVLEQLKAFLP